MQIILLSWYEAYSFYTEALAVNPPKKVTDIKLHHKMTVMVMVRHELFTNSFMNQINRRFKFIDVNKVLEIERGSCEEQYVSWINKIRRRLCVPSHPERVKI